MVLWLVSMALGMILYTVVNVNVNVVLMLVLELGAQADLVWAGGREELERCLASTLWPISRSIAQSGRSLGSLPRGPKVNTMRFRGVTKGRDPAAGSQSRILELAPRHSGTPRLGVRVAHPTAHRHGVWELVSRSCRLGSRHKGPRGASCHRGGWCDTCGRPVVGGTIG